MSSSKRKKPIIGIPQALFYWKNPFFWEEFFKNLGFEVVLSPKTNKEIVEKGVRIADPETCFSVKILFGHLLFLEDRVDSIFIPRLKTKETHSQNLYSKSENILEYCPKFFGIPDVAKILLKTEILTLTLDERKEKLKKSLKIFAKKITKNSRDVDIKEAIEKAFSVANQNEKEREESFSQKMKSEKKKIILISHPYNLYDEYANIGIKKKIERLGGEPIFIDEIPLTSISSLSPRFHWEFGEEIMRKINNILKNYDVAGAIEISAFQCGCDAVLKEFVEREFKKNKIPFLYLMIDEHTGEAGFQTRLEAFFDTLR